MKKPKTVGKNIKPPGRCIFCGHQGNLTKQHVFSNMLKEFIPRTNQGSLHFEKFDGFKPGKQLLNMMKPRVEQGDMGVKQIRNVCHDCNSIWINSTIEQRVKSILGKLILGTSLGIPSEDKQPLINWIAVTTIMAEFTGRDDRAIQRDVRRYLRENNKPDSSWYIYIGNYTGIETQLYRHATFLPVDPQKVHEPGYSITDSPDNCQCTVMIHGKLFIVAATIPLNEIESMFKHGISPYSDKLIRLLPVGPSGNNLINTMFNLEPVFERHWPPRFDIDDNDLFNISNIFKDISRAIESSGNGYRVERLGPPTTETP